MSENHVFRGRGRMHLNSVITWWEDPGTPLLLAWCLLLFFLYSSPRSHEIWKLLPPWASSSVPMLPCKLGPGIKPTRQGISLLPAMCCHPEAIGQKAICFTPAAFHWAWGCLWGLSWDAFWTCIELGAQPLAGVEEVKDFNVQRLETVSMTWPWRR